MTEAKIAEPKLTESEKAKPKRKLANRDLKYLIYVTMMLQRIHKKSQSEKKTSTRK